MQELSRLAPGTMLGDRYRIEELISIGGMGAVYSASHLFLNRRLAIKVLRNDLPGAEMMADRFRREAIAASAIGHENIVRVTDMGMSPENTPYLVMELLEGSDLADTLDAAPFTVSRAVRIIYAVLRGLGAAHRAGIVHRDLKPENIFLANEHGREVVKILDFGVSLLERPEVPNTRLTTTGVVVGTPRYMSPEQARGDYNLTGAVDIYAAGVVLYEMLTGAAPYKGENYNVIIHQIIAGDLIPIEEKVSGVPDGVAAVIRRAMSIEPSHRFATADEMADALGPYVELEVRPGPPSGRKQPMKRHEPRNTAETVQHGGVARTDDSDGSDDPAWTAGPGGLNVGDRARQFTGDEYLERTRDKKGGHNLVIGIVAAVAIIAAVFVVLSREDGSDDKAAAAADAGAAQIASADTTSAGETAPTTGAGTDVTPPVVADTSAETTPPAVPDDPEPVNKTPEPDDTKPDPRPTPPKSSDGKSSDGKSSGGSSSSSSSVTITVLVIPPSAKVVASGGSVSGKQITAKRGATVKVRLEAPGYVSQNVTVKADRDRDIVRTLSREPEPEPEPKPKDPEPAKDPDPKPDPQPDPAPDPKPDPKPTVVTAPDGSQIPVVPAPKASE